AVKPVKAGSSKPRIASNVYTGMAFIATVMLAVAIIFVLNRSSTLFGSVGELFNLQPGTQTTHVAAPTPVVEPDQTTEENQ
ncbi:MAG: hypothetical protein JKX85_00995, partial [Phycisphaeraceae bacterium]|nr:hypothetical protein [Phycisphaeraceae bacterium]